MLRLISLSLALLILPMRAHAVILRAAPHEAILNQTNPQRGYADLVLHNIAVLNDSAAPLENLSLRVEIMDGDAAVLTKTITSDRLTRDAQGLAELAESGADMFVNSQLLSQSGLSGLFGREAQPARKATLAPGEALATIRHHFSVDFAPGRARVTAMSDGRPLEGGVLEIPIRRYEAPVGYALPLDGAWAMHALPSIESHHRLNPATEFAVDFFKLDAAGRARRGDPGKARNYFGYGAPVKAAADGEVAFVISDAVQDRAVYLLREGETRQQRAQRISAYNFERMAQDFRKATAGNIVVLRHERDGAIEYSSYGHLKTDSVRVALGDRVRQGQVIGEVGDTGDSPVVHLHFQINAGPDPFATQSLPTVFEDLEFVGPSRDPGRFVQRRERP